MLIFDIPLNISWNTGWTKHYHCLLGFLWIVLFEYYFEYHFFCYFQYELNRCTLNITSSTAFVCNMEALDKKLKMMGRPMKSFSNEILGCKILSTMVPWLKI